MICEIVREAIDVRAIEASVLAPSCGGIVSFCGVVRERADDGREVEGLYYEAHEGMARASFMAIAEEVRATMPEVRLAIVHRVGALSIGEVAVAVVAAAPHRAEAFAAARFAIDALKERSPIWKQERYCDGERVWVENRCSGERQ
ncbi:MAG: molybdenum cofactor biosynthesis protein MoaE [Candidatus Eremiobacteraeota bacterium]|uniref:Molybdopterin converting factor, large subunit n=1 Tax=mine drainage metagenome TaxID=410659 RepID=E6PCE5_9ZZZZ|nr:molybdenum cofactor biosynthesis protein MoaE [Candidatus Eremiobacteraeota bacterium]